MKVFVLLLTAVILMLNTSQSQNTIESVLLEIQANNTTLKALQQEMLAEKANNKTGLNPANPEAGFNYLWGKPQAMGNRTDISLTQSFDFPTVYLYKNRLADRLDIQAELEYEAHRKEILLEARLNCIDLIYHQLLKTALEERGEHAGEIAGAYRKMFESGETGILEYNKAQLNHTNVLNDIAGLNAEIAVLFADLTRLNGGKSISLEMDKYPIIELPENFDAWYHEAEQHNPVLKLLEEEVLIRDEQKKIEQALSLPGFSAGYMSEKVVGEQFQGVTLGVSIPLWENRNTVKAAKASKIATQSLQTDTRLQFRSGLEIQYAKAKTAQVLALSYRNSMQLLNNADLLRKALDEGEISMIEYILEMQFFYESVSKMLEAEWEMHKAVAKLEKWN